MSPSAQESVPQISQELTKVQLDKRTAMQTSFEKIESLAGFNSDTKEKLEAAIKLLDEVRGKNYREEQALAKLVEYFTLELQAEALEKEITTIFPDAEGKLGEKEKKTSSTDGKYLVH